MVQLRRMTVWGAITATTVATVVAVATPAVASTSVPGTFNAVTPTRVLDTRSGLGVPRRTIPARGTVTFKALQGVTTNAASAVWLNVTAISPGATGFVSVFPGGAARPNVANINFDAGRSQSNDVITKVGSGSTVTVYNGSTAPLNVSAAVSGYWTAGTVTTAGGLSAITPTRIYDSRAKGSAPLAARSSATIPVAGHGGVPSDATAVVLDLSAYSAAKGWVSADTVSGPNPTSAVSFSPGKVRDDLTIVPLNPNGTISLYNGSTSVTSFQLDLFGWFVNGSDSTAGTPSSGGAYVPTSAYRAVDTRGGRAIAPGATQAFSILQSGQNSAFTSVVVSISTGANANGFYAPWSGVGAYTSGDTIPVYGQLAQSNTVQIPVNSDGTISVHNGTSKPLDLEVDVQGFVLADSSSSSASARHAEIANDMRRDRALASH